MDKDMLLEILVGGRNPYLHVLLRIVAFFVYTVFLKRVLNIPIVFGVFLAIGMMAFIPLTLFLPIFGICWTIHRCCRWVASLFKKQELATLEIQDRTEGFVFDVEGRNIRLDNPYRGVYIQGGAGSGKSVSLIHPILKQAVIKNYAGVCYDFKSPELARLLFRAASKSNSTIKPYFIDFKDARRSTRVNPLNPKLLSKIAYAHEYAQTLMYNLSPNNIKNEDYWMMEAKSVLTGLIWYLRTEHPEYCTLPHIISLILHSDSTELIEKISGNLQTAGYVASLRQAMKNEATNQISGVVSTLQTNLAKLNTPDIFWVLSGNDIDLNINDPLNPKFVCIGNESTLAETYAPVISLLLSVALKQMNQPEKHKSIVLVDELPTLYINRLEQTPATARSNKVATVLACQDFSQLVDRYGRDKAQVILSNMGNQFYGRTVNKDSAQMICQLFGKADQTFKTNSMGDNYRESSLFGKETNSLNKSITETIQERDRVKTTDVMNLGPGQFYGFIAEGNAQEILKSQFRIPENFQGGSFEFPLKATNEDIQVNYLKIIWEAKSMFSTKRNTEGDLIQL